MKNLSLKVNDELHAQATEKAQQMGVSLADFTREAIRVSCTSVPRDLFQTGGEAIEELRAQLRVKDTQIEQLHQHLESEQESRQQQNAIIMQQTQQLDRAQLQLEDLRQRRTVWQRFRAAFVSESG